MKKAAEKKDYRKRLQVAYNNFMSDPNTPLRIHAEKNNVGYGYLTTYITDQFKNVLMR